MLKKQPQSKNIREGFTDESGNEVVVINAQYSSRNISVMIDMFKPDYCAEHKQEIESAVTAFLGELNALLSGASLPTVKTE